MSLYLGCFVIAAGPIAGFLIALILEEITLMTKLTIKTDHKWKPFVYRSDVPAKVLASEFDYQKEDEALDGFFNYRGHWYHLDGFMAIPCISPLAKNWNGYVSDSWFSGVVIKVSKDGETYQVGTYYS